MLTELVLLSVAILLVPAGLLIARHKRERIWAVGHSHALDGECDFKFISVFESKAAAEKFLGGLTHPDVTALIRPIDDCKRWQVVGTARMLADAKWFKTVVSDWGDALESVSEPRDAFIAMAGMSGGPTGFVLEAGATAEANA